MKAASDTNARSTRQNVTCIGPVAARAGLAAGYSDPHSSDATTSASVTRQRRAPLQEGYSLVRIACAAMTLANATTPPGPPAYQEALLEGLQPLLQTWVSAGGVQARGWLAVGSVSTSRTTGLRLARAFCRAEPTSVGRSTRTPSQPSSFAI